MTISNLHRFLRKTFDKLYRNFLNLTKNICKNPTANIVFDGEKLDTFPLRSVTTPIQIIVEFQANEIRKADKRYTY